MAQSPVKIGVVGCGNISGIYFKNARGVEGHRGGRGRRPDRERAAPRPRSSASPASVPCRTPGRPEIEIVLNLTIPKAHAEVALAALKAGQARLQREAARHPPRRRQPRCSDLPPRRRLRVGGAPDTFLGAGIQTCRKLIDDGCDRRARRRHRLHDVPRPRELAPGPGVLLQAGGGPMFDMGPYYLTALVNLIGPIAPCLRLERASPSRSARSRASRSTAR